jgi:hypothetical protein
MAKFATSLPFAPRGAKNLGKQPPGSKKRPKRLRPSRPRSRMKPTGKAGKTVALGMGAVRMGTGNPRPRLAKGSKAGAGAPRAGAKGARRKSY